MRNRIRSGSSNLFHLIAMVALFAVAMLGGARAHVALAEATAAPGSRYAAHFRVGHGCSGSPTTALRVEIPKNVTAVVAEPLPGWSLQTEKSGSRVTAIRWQDGRIDDGKPNLFAVAMRLPAVQTELAFPVTQTCQTGEEHWTELPVAGVKLKRPAPVLRVALVPASTGSVTVTEGWFRALPPAVPSGGYFTLRNGGGTSVTLTGADSPACGMLMLHQSQNHGGMNHMAHVTDVDVPAGGTLAFAPGGLHLMCMAAKPMPKPGALVPVTLRFKDRHSLNARFEVRGAAGK